MKPEPSTGSLRTRGAQIHSLTSVRGIAAWWVVFFHFDSYLRPHLPAPVFYFISKGYLAVDLFFCLSGFVIFLNYGTIKIAQKREVFIFFLRRLAKIYPLHLLTICLYALLLGAMLATGRHAPLPRFSLDGLLFNLLLVQDWVRYPVLTWNVPSWSISAEFAAYLLFPVLIIVLRPLAGRLIASLVAIGMSLFVLNVFYAATDFQIGAAIESFGVIRCVTQFSIGAILAQLFLAGRVTGRFAPVILGAIAAALFTLGFMDFESVLIPAACAALVLATALANDKLAFLNRRWVVFIGEISYATYMIHYFIRDVFKLTLVHADGAVPPAYLAATLAAIFILSIPLYLWVERPAQKYFSGLSLKLRPSDARPGNPLPSPGTIG